jgi:excisionase family DNA binding protein
LEIETQLSLRQPPAKVMTVNEIAKYFGIPKKRVYEMLRRESVAGFPCFRVGRGWRVDMDQMRDWMCQQAERKSPALWLHRPPKEPTQ